MLDASGNVYVTGITSGAFPITNGAYQNTFGGGNTDAFVSKFALSTFLKDTIGVKRLDQANNQSGWYLRLANSQGYADIAFDYGGPTSEYPVVGDWNGDGVTTIGVVHQTDGTFQLSDSNNSGSPIYTFVLGNANDMPIAGHWDNTVAHDGVGVFRPSNGLIYLKKQLATGYADYQMVLGIPGDQGLAGDWDGNGFDSPGVYRPSNSSFYLSNKVCNCSVYADYAFAYGLGGDAPVVGDWTGLGHDGIGLFRQSNGYTYLKNQLTTGYADITFTYEIAGDVPVAGHWKAGVYVPPPAQANPGRVLVPPSAVPVPTSGLGD